jgi:hypothetical protein
LNGTHQLCCADVVNMLDESTNTTKKNTEALLETSREVVVLSYHQTAGENRRVLSSNKSFENVANFKYFRMTVTYQNSILKEIKIRINFGNAFYHSVQSLLSSSLLSPL